MLEEIFGQFFERILREISVEVLERFLEIPRKNLRNVSLYPDQMPQGSLLKKCWGEFMKEFGGIWKP